MHISIPIIIINLKAFERIATNIHFSNPFDSMWKMQLAQKRNTKNGNQTRVLNEIRRFIHSFIHIFLTEDITYWREKRLIYQLFSIFRNVVSIACRTKERTECTPEYLFFRAFVHGTTRILHDSAWMRYKLNEFSSIKIEIEPFDIDIWMERLNISNDVGFGLIEKEKSQFLLIISTFFCVQLILYDESFFLSNHYRIPFCEFIFVKYTLKMKFCVCFCPFSEENPGFIDIRNKFM